MCVYVFVYIYMYVCVDSWVNDAYCIYMCV